MMIADTTAGPGYCSLPSPEQSKPIGARAVDFQPGMLEIVVV
jgi:hypothetical protein